MPYVDTTIIPVRKANLEKYREAAKVSCLVWREHGALDYTEWIADDAKPGKLTSYPQSVMLEADEVVIIGCITYESRAHRDEVNEKVMGDPRMKDLMTAEGMPFDGKRMIYGGFEPFDVG